MSDNPLLNKCREHIKIGVVEIHWDRTLRDGEGIVEIFIKDKSEFRGGVKRAFAFLASLIPGEEE